VKYPKSIQNLIDEFKNLPTVGPKTAERYVFYLLKQGPDKLRNFSDTIRKLKDDIVVCKKCFAVMETDPCNICSNTNRDTTTICVVANTRELMSIESSREYNGVYHVLGGTLNAVAGVRPDDLTIKALLLKIADSSIKEVILALNPDMNGETTAMYLTKLLKSHNIKITRIAKGLPTGANLEYADELTLANALRYRNEL
jgi:recombination protein RecR